MSALGSVSTLHRESQQAVLRGELEEHYRQVPDQYLWWRGNRGSSRYGGAVWTWHERLSKVIEKPVSTKLTSNTSNAKIEWGCVTQMTQ